MLDSLGIYQHHDGITGTAKQHVADDYSLRMYNSMMKKNNPVYSNALNDLVISQQSTISSNNWQWCERLNGTYLDCPVSQHPTSNFLIAAHNPSLVDQKFVRAKVSHGNYQVKVWDPVQRVFVAVSKAAVICVARQIESLQVVNDCDLHVKTLIPANGFQLIQLTYNSQVDLTIKASSSGSIAGLTETLIMKQYDKEGVHFTLLKEASGKMYKLAFDIRSYYSYQGGSKLEGSNAGAYLFRPADDS